LSVWVTAITETGRALTLQGGYESGATPLVVDALCYRPFAEIGNRLALHPQKHKGHQEWASCRGG
jgi:hypothetical protein